ncbi:MAG: TIGR02147 family protein [Chitinispirillaceae bacterium]|nr:TIGR02147 family protein [Chitinispirillaceae bacterium]
MDVNIYNYLDYRHYLTDLFSFLKKNNPSFSFRAFAKLAGSSSPNFLQLIQARKLNIQTSGMHALSQNLKLSRKERSYFEYMVEFDHAKTHDQKDRFFRQMLLAREYKQIQTLDKRQYELFSHWYIPVIRELVVDLDANGDPARIGEKIIPPVSAAKVRKGIEILSTLGLIRKNESGAWIHTERVVSTPSEVLSVAVTTYHKNVLHLAREAIERFPPEERDIRSVTLGVASEGYAEVKKRLEMFWKELLAFAETQHKATRIFQVNLQMFPLSRNEEKKP